MRQLWRTGYMHNRVRMIAASFLIKHLADRLAARRGMVLGHALRRRPRQQSNGLAVGRGLGRRRGPLLSHLQSRPAGREVRPRRRLCAPVGPRTRPPRSAPCPRALAGAGRRRWRGPASCSARPIRSPSSITPPPAPGRSQPSPRSGRTLRPQARAKAPAASSPARSLPCTAAWLRRRWRRARAPLRRAARSRCDS